MRVRECRPEATMGVGVGMLGEGGGLSEGVDQGHCSVNLK